MHALLYFSCRNSGNLKTDCARGASVSTSAAFRTFVGIDGVDFALRDCSDGAFVDTSTACNAV